jgi:hypothetical protein
MGYMVTQVAVFAVGGAVGVKRMSGAAAAPSTAAAAAAVKMALEASLLLLLLLQMKACLGRVASKVPVGTEHRHEQQPHGGNLMDEVQECEGSVANGGGSS